MKKFALLFMLFSSSLVSDGSKILIAAPFGTKSHQNTYVQLAKALADRGHDLTVVTNYASADFKGKKNIREIVIDELVVDTSKYPSFLEMIFKPDYWAILKLIYSATFEQPLEVAEKTFKNQQVRQLIEKKESYDLILISQVCGLVGYPLAWHFKAPAILLSPNILFPGTATALGGEEHYSYVPFVMSSYTDKMTFYERMLNMLKSNAFLYFGYLWHMPAIRSIAQREVLPDCPPLLEIEKNISLVFINTHPTFNYPRTLPPQVIEVGGMHCRRPNPLPTDLESFVSSSDSGFILFGVGSFMKMDDMPEELAQAFIKVFARLPHRIIWQWKGQPRKDLPENVLPMSWLPQQDLLGHKGCRLFMTHGGLNSLQEAIYHGVPVLGLPLGLDQTSNLLRSVREGYALKLDWKEVSEEKLYNSLQDLLYNTSYANNAKRLSNLYRDQLETPLERAVYWAEFTIRHKGVDHLRLASTHLSPLQRNLIDVYFLLFIIVVVPWILLFFCVRRYCCGRDKKAQATKLSDSRKKRQ